MKTINLQLTILLLSIFSQVAHTQEISKDSVSTRIQNDYEAETFYLYNKASSKGRLGGITANAEGPTVFSNSMGQPINFAFGAQHDYALKINVLGEALSISAPKDPISIWGKGGLRLSSGNDTLTSDIYIGYRGEIEMGRDVHPDGAVPYRLTVRNGNILADGGDIVLNKGKLKVEKNGIDVNGKLRVQSGGMELVGGFRMVNPDISEKQFAITGSIGGYWLGTETNNSLSIGTFDGTHVKFYESGATVFFKKRRGDDIPISTANLDKYSVFVMGGILSEDFAIGPQSSWSDYVFTKDYNLRPLSEVESFIKENNHLPDIPSESEISTKGYSLHDMNVKLLQKVEELTLYSIQQNKELEELKGKVLLYESYLHKIEQKLRK